MAVVIVGCPCEVDVVESSVDIVLWSSNVQKLDKGRLVGISLGNMNKCCVKRRRETSFGTLAVGWELGKLHPAKGTWDILGI